MFEKLERDHLCLGPVRLSVRVDRSILVEQLWLNTPGDTIIKGINVLIKEAAM
jgi:hypothetical protein